MSDTWAAAFFQGAIMLLVFGLGVPAYVLQLAVPDDVRRVVRRQRIVGEGGVFALAIVFLVCLVLLVAILSQEQHLWRTELGWLVRGVMLVSIFGTVLLWWYHTRRSVVDFVIRRLERQVTMSIGQRRAYDPSCAEDIVSIGAAATQSGDRLAAIRALGNMAGALQGQNNYDGLSLEQVVVGIERIATSESGWLDREGFAAAVMVLEAILDRSVALGLGQSHDARGSSLALSRLSTVAIRAGWIGIAMEIVGKMRSDARSQLRIARAALAEGEFSVVASVLNGLEAEAQRDPAASRAALVAVLAHCWAEGGAVLDMASSFAARIFRDGREFAAEVTRAKLRSERGGDVQTAECLGALLSVLKGRDRASALPSGKASTVPSRRRGKQEGIGGQARRRKKQEGL